MQLVAALAVRRAHQPRRSGSRCARSSAARSTSSCRPRPPTTRSCCRSARTTASRSSEVPALPVAAATVDDTLRARDPRLADVPGPLALEPQPLAAGAAVPRRPPQPAADPAHGVRRPHGRGVPAGGGVPGERRRPDRDPRPRARAPDDRRHAARGARRRRPARAARAHGGRRGARALPSTPPSRRCSRTRSSPRGRTRSSTTRSCRTGAPTRCTCGAACRSTWRRSARSTRQPIERVHDEITPGPETGRRPARPAVARRSCCARATSGATLWRRAGRSAAAAQVLDTTASSCGARPKRVADAARRARRRATTRSCALLRGHLELCGVTTVDALAAATTLPADDGRRRRWPRSSTRGSRMQGRYTRRRDGHRVGGPPAAGAHALLLEAHRGGTAFEPVTAQDFMRFLLRWQHVAPGTQLSGEAGLVAVLEQLQGFEAPPAAWEPELLARRLRHYDPAWLDRLCHDGEVGLAAAHAARVRRRRRRRPARRPRPRRSRSCSATTSAGCSRRPAAADAADRRCRRHRRGARGAARSAAPASRTELAAATRRTARRHRAGAVGRRRPRPGHVRRLRRDPLALKVSQPRRRLRASRAAGPGCGEAATRVGRCRWALVARAAQPSARPGPRRAGRGGRRAAAQPLGRAVPRPGGPRLAPVPVARGPVGAAAARGPRPGARRALRQPASAASSTRCPRRSSSSRTCASCPGPASGSPSTRPTRSTWRV